MATANGLCSTAGTVPPVLFTAGIIPNKLLEIFIVFIVASCILKIH
jgi:hypothetical protein